MKQYFTILTLGCKINQYESHALREAWQRAGWTATHNVADTDIVLVNSCAVTAGALRDVRTTVRKAIRTNPLARIIVTGCAAQSDRDGLGDLADIVEFVPQSEKVSLMAGPPPQKPSSVDGLPDLSPSRTNDFHISGYERGRAVLKIQDGCSHRCTYCIIPSARGSSRSRPLPNIIEETDRLLAGGFGEIVISGINLAQYGRDEASPQIADMWDLLRLFNTRYADKYLGKARFRLSSLYPAQLTGKMKDKALRTLSEVPLVCPHLHLSLQSLSPEVLLRMGRKSYDMAGIHIFLKELASIWPAYGLGADFICGFPGETNYEFQQTLEYTELLPLSYAHVFPYSARPGTLAAKMDNPVSQTEKINRAKQLRDIVTDKKIAFIRRLATLDEVEVALEQNKPANGTNQYYTECFFEGPEPNVPPGQLVKARPVQPKGQRLLVAAL